ncbi:MAG: hypothetical protein ACYTFY_22440, partial [Planctomycetota bacterium]
TYLGKYYKGHLTNEFCEAAIRRIITPLKENKTILAYHLVDEPHVSKGNLENFLRFKKVFDEVDPIHPATMGSSGYASYFEDYKPVSIFDRYSIRGEFYNPWDMARVTELTYKRASGPVWAIAPAFYNIYYRRIYHADKGGIPSY